MSLEAMYDDAATQEADGHRPSSPRLRRVAAGNPGIKVTVDEMWRFILGYDPDHALSDVLGRLRAQAESILRTYRVQHATNVFQAAAIYDWVQIHMGYVGDHVLVEEIRSPWRMLDDIEQHGDTMGDCDDFVILQGALEAAIGIPFSIARTSMNPSGEFDHVFQILETSSGSIVADAIAKEDGKPVKFGWHIPFDRVTNFVDSLMPTTMEEVGL